MPSAAGTITSRSIRSPAGEVAAEPVEVAALMAARELRGERGHDAHREQAVRAAGRT